jgi:uncharacterized protein (DUF2147 family)
MKFINKTILVAIIAFVATLFSSQTFAQAQPGDGIIGVWLNQDKDAHISVYRANNGKYYGKIAWLQRPNDENGKPRLDVNNANAEAKKKPLMGTIIINGFDYNEKSKEYVNGKVYNSKDGKIYAGFLRLNADGTVYMKGGYKVAGMLIGKENLWTKVK